MKTVSKGAAAVLLMFVNSSLAAGTVGCVDHSPKLTSQTVGVLVKSNCATPKLIDICSKIQGRDGSSKQAELLTPGQVFQFSYRATDVSRFTYSIKICDPETGDARKDLCMPICPADIVEPEKKIDMGEGKAESAECSQVHEKIYDANRIDNPLSSSRSTDLCAFEKHRSAAVEALRNDAKYCMSATRLIDAWSPTPDCH